MAFLGGANLAVTSKVLKEGLFLPLFGAASTVLVNLFNESGCCSLPQEAGDFSISVGEFEEPKERTVIMALNCFFHKVEFTQKTTTVIQVYPRKGEIWALYSYEENKLRKAQNRTAKRGKEMTATSICSIWW